MWLVKQLRKFMQTHTKAWYASWFNTNYYHVLYQDRNHEEAQSFIENISSYLNIAQGAKVLDLACGRGRHSIYLNQLGYDVLGVDLSDKSIDFAKQHENQTLKFKVQDMRLPLEEKFDVVFNLFTSFGYFPSNDDNLKTLQAIHSGLNDYGVAVLDFMNADVVLKNLKSEEVVVKQDIAFNIKRWHDQTHIYKNIQFSDAGTHYDFTEKVQILWLQDFEKMMEQAGIYLLDVFGDYKLSKFHEQTSERLILIFK